MHLFFLSVVYETPTNGLIFLSIEQMSEKLKDIRVRRNMSLSFDKELNAVAISCEG